MNKTQFHDEILLHVWEEWIECSASNHVLLSGPFPTYNCIPCSWNSALTVVLWPRIFQFLIQSQPHLNSQIYGHRRWHMGLNSWQISNSSLRSGQSAFWEEIGEMCWLWSWPPASLTDTLPLTHSVPSPWTAHFIWCWLQGLRPPPPLGVLLV